ncbi:MAG: sulfatase-modifying factor protein [Gammaproteobacteria bacterium]|nr:MAG: sulfatase-modifying factor protein [Gammaproteobacteria bacterium]
MNPDWRTNYSAVPDPFPVPWASAYGEDQYGYWATLSLGSVEQLFRWIHPGRFSMGSPLSEPKRDDDEIPHQVLLSHGFWLAETSCTQELWSEAKERAENPAHFKGAQRPVDSVSWDDAQQWIEQLNRHVNSRGAQSGGGQFRLPSEAEWEFSCRAETQTPFNVGNTITPDQLNYDGKFPYDNGAKGLYRKETVPVKSFSPNSWGLYEMHGNVLEWCQDYYGEYPKSEILNPLGPAKGNHRVLRGGTWIYSGRRCRSAYRSDFEPAVRGNGVGLRLAWGPIQTSQDK